MAAMVSASTAAVECASVKPPMGPSMGTSSNGDLLRNGHHHLLQLGLGAERDQPDLAAGILRGQVGGFIERAGGPGIEHRGQHHFIFQARTGSGTLTGSKVCRGSGTIPAQTTRCRDV